MTGLPPERGEPTDGPDKRADLPAPPHAAATAGAPETLSRALKAARWSLIWERLWPHIARLLTVIGFFLAGSWAGAWLVLPGWGRMAALAGFFAGLVWIVALFVKNFRLPTHGDALRHLDREAGLAHRPVTAITDEIKPTDDPFTRALWQAHRERTLAAIGRLRAGLPKPLTARMDPWALRALAAVLVVATFIAAEGERWQRIADAFSLSGMVEPSHVRIDAWVTPPAYTGRPPVILSGTRNEAASNTPITVPAGSVLVIRASGGGALDVDATGAVAAAPADKPPPEGVTEKRLLISGNATAAIKAPQRWPVWTFEAIADQPPTIALAKEPERQAHGSLLLSYTVTDDYGVSEAHALFAPAETKGRALFPVPEFSLVLPPRQAKQGTAQTIKDLTEHPFAGADMTLTLTAKDQAGNEGRSEPTSVKLPERVFANPLARALIEQRRVLALDGDARGLVGEALAGLMIAPEIFTPKAGMYLGLREIAAELDRAASDDDLRSVVASLWALAVSIEDGNLTDVEKELRAAQERLKQALERGAPDEEIRKLTDELRSAMNKYMRQLAEQAMKNPQQLARPLDPNTKVMRPQDLRNMIDRLEQLSRSGDKDAARQLLEQLQAMLENLQMAQPGQSGEQDMQSAMNELGDIIRKQQQLRDRTYQRGQDMRRDRQRGSQGEQGKQGLGGLGQDQQNLNERLEQLLEELRKRGLAQQGQKGQNQNGQSNQGEQGGPDLSDAERAMSDALGQLQGNDADSATNSQGEALEALRKGAKSLAEAMQKQMGEGQGEDGQGNPQGRQQSEGPSTDPLGRSLSRNNGPLDESTGNMITGGAAQRAQRILEELRRRFSEQGRPQIELDYLERLLKGFN